jgi:SAM-dependent methyltransferase
MKNKYSHKSSYYNDIALKLGHQLLGIKYLHYGYFEDTNNVTLESLQVAQEVYAKRLISKIPQDVKTILDVGCGTGEIARQLVEKGYSVICIAPDPYLIQKTLENTNNRVKTFTDLYENITDIDPASIDLILMSESCQYIKPDPGWEQNKKILRKGGYLLVCDFFKVREIDDPHMSKSGQPLDNFYERAKNANFSLLSEEDITSNVAPTMTLTQNLIYEKVFPIGEAFFEFINRRYPNIYKIGSYFLSKKIIKIKNKYSALGADKFCYYKKYLTLLFQKN